jgi:DNA polymerase III delta subunit
LTLAFGYKDNAIEDVHALARQRAGAKIVMVAGPRAKEVLLEKNSALFVEENILLVLSDPSPAFIKEMEGTLRELKEKMHIVIYSTSPDFELPPSLGATRVTLEKEKEKRIKEKVRSAMKADGKKMTEKALALLKDRLRDESMLDEELSKLMNYTAGKDVIDLKDVAAVITEASEEDFIGLSDALASRDKKEIIFVFESLLSQGMNILALHAFMARHIRLLLQAKDMEEEFKNEPDYRLFVKSFEQLKERFHSVPGEKKHYLAYQKPFYAYKLFKTSRKFTKKALISFLEMLASLDVAVKKGTRHDRTKFEAGLTGV